MPNRRLWCDKPKPVLYNRGEDVLVSGLRCPALKLIAPTPNEQRHVFRAIAEFISSFSGTSLTTEPIDCGRLLSVAESRP